MAGFSGVEWGGLCRVGNLLAPINISVRAKPKYVLLGWFFFSILRDACKRNK